MYPQAVQNVVHSVSAGRQWRRRERAGEQLMRLNAVRSVSESTRSLRGRAHKVVGAIELPMQLFTQPVVFFVRR